MVETFAELREQFQKEREHIMKLYAKATGEYGSYYVDDPESYYQKNIEELKKHESP